MTLEVTVAAPEWSRLDFDPAETAREAYQALATHCTDLQSADAVILQLDADSGVQALNRQFRGQDKPTNVLAFPAAPTPGPGLPETADGRVRGDIVLALETIRAEADAQNKPMRDHVAHLVIHGVLHLLGHDHQEPLEAACMEALETRILKDLGIADPYAPDPDQAGGASPDPDRQGDRYG